MKRDYGSVSFRDNIFVVGGFNDETGVLSSCEVFNINTKQFTYIRPMNKPRWGFAAAISGYKMYCSDGIDADEDGLYTVTSFNLYTEEWKEESRMDEMGCSGAVTVYAD